MTSVRAPGNNAGDPPKVLGGLGDGSGFLVDRRADGKEVTLRQGEAFGGKRAPPAAPPSPASDARGERAGTVIPRSPSATPIATPSNPSRSR